MSNDYARIRAGNTSVAQEEMYAVRSGEKDWNIHFVERNSDYQGLFTRKYEDLITEKLGHDNWGLWFIQGRMETDWWLCDIYADSFQEADKIAGILTNYPFPYLKVDYSHMGTVATYNERL